ncbi:MAG: plasmid pRiA4b ORF-3 family protein [Ardenticatenia bacterium]|nr:plasmid pRiA4b ORF-3 family protein [Ardenticatenia bacterium]
MARTVGPAPIFQFKITLKRSKPPIWRRVLMSSAGSPADLHEVIQRSMGWYDVHLHEFDVGGLRVGVPDPDWDDGEVEHEAKFPLRKVFGAPKTKVLYTYDFGDDWEHVVLLEAILPADPTCVLPRCIAGARARPPEDVGGIWGYEEAPASLKDPADPEHASWKEWFPEDFDAAAFDLDEVNDSLTDGPEG